MNNPLKNKALLFFVTILLLGCTDQREDFLASTVSSYNEEMTSENPGLRSENEHVTPLESDKAILSNYYNDLKTLAFESKAMTAEPLNYSSYKEIPIDEILRNPMIAHLQFLDIEEEGTNKSIHFYDLSLEDREDFLNAYLKEEQKNLEEKVALFPELLTEIEEYDHACRKIFSDRNIERLDYNKMCFRDFTIEKQSSKKLRMDSNPTEELDLFDLIEKELNSQNKDKATRFDTFDQPILKSSSGKIELNDVDRNRIISKHINGGASKGDILFRKKKWLAFGDKFSIAGHVGIIKIPLTWESYKKSIFSIDSTPEDKKKGFSDGVQEMRFDTWAVSHAVLGIQKIVSRRSKVKIRGRYRYHRAYIPIKDLSKMAERANEFIGVHYGNIFKSMKAVPNKFICSSLVWYCAKIAYGIDISNGAKRSVWPYDILRDSHTYIKFEYKK